MPQPYCHTIYCDCFICILKRLLKATRQPPACAAIKPRELMKNMSKVFGHQYKSYASQDAHDFMLKLTEAINRTYQLKDQTRNKQNNTTNTHRGIIIVEEKCCNPNCSFSGKTKKPFHTLTLDIEGENIKSVENALNDYFSNDQFTESINPCHPGHKCCTINKVIG